MTETTRPNVVWILGSGFSRSLGGPLLYDLLSELAQDEVAAKFPTINWESVYGIFRRFRRQSRESVRNYWDHAEQFLDFVDTAEPEESHRKGILETALNPYKNAEAPALDRSRFRDRCAQAIAAECLFTMGARPQKLEAWEPYVRWAAGRYDSDTVLTFNYDLVLETLGELRGISALGRETVLKPGHDERLDGVQGAGCASILKLHGSVDWADGGGLIRTVPDAAEAIRMGTVPLIATPGPTKSVRRRGHFRKIWDEAIDRLTTADVVVFLGYRFPPSDSEARGILLRALWDNKRPHVRVHTVLGPRTTDEDTVRLTKLLELTLAGSGRRQLGGGDPSYSLIVQPLYVEDFLSVLNNRELFGPLFASVNAAT